MGGGVVFIPTEKKTLRTRKVMKVWLSQTFKSSKRRKRREMQTSVQHVHCVNVWLFQLSRAAFLFCLLSK